MIKVGQIFNKNGVEFCVIDILTYDNKKYILLATQANNIDYYFYEVENKDNKFIFNIVDDEDVNAKLFDMIGGCIYE